MTVDEARSARAAAFAVCAAGSTDPAAWLALSDANRELDHALAFST